MGLSNAFKAVMGRVARASLVAIISLAASGAVMANDNNVHKADYGNVKADYVQNCTSNSCAPTDAVGWSDKVENWDAVAVSVRMGTHPAKTDQETKEWLEGGFKHFGAKKYKFFFEQNDAAATGISFHVRGGTSDLYTWDREDLVAAVERYARQANNPNFAKERVSHDVE